MNTLPLEIENEIWNLHYMNLYKDNIVTEINKIKFLFNSIHNSCHKIKDKILLKKDVDNILKEDIIFINERIKYIISNKVFYLVFKNNNYYNYIYQIAKFNNAYNDLPISCRLTAAYLNKLSNFNPKLIKKLKIICNEEPLSFYKNIVRSIKP